MTDLNYKDLMVGDWPNGMTSTYHGHEGISNSGFLALSLSCSTLYLSVCVAPVCTLSKVTKIFLFYLMFELTEIFHHLKSKSRIDSKHV